jgi:secondary thiamine-phosphate synthase enzyme
MAVMMKRFGKRMKGFSEVKDITDEVAEAVAESGMSQGIALAFVAGSTASITTIEYESGAVKDLQRAVRALAPEEGEYEHNRRWHDGNGFAHVRAALLGPGLAVPFAGRKLALGTWQQIVLVDHDNREREREVIVQIVGE